MNKSKIVQIRLHGRGGQGTVTAAELLAVAAFYQGKEVQAFPNFGVERRGAPVEAYARLSDQPIRIREQGYEPDFVIIQDPSLISPGSKVLQGINKDVVVIINSDEKVYPEIKTEKVFYIPATQIALDIIGKPFINTALIGAFGAISGLINEKALEQAIREKFVSKPDLIEVNVKAMKEAYSQLK